MKQRWMSGLVAVVLAVGLVGVAGAIEKVRVTGQENKPARVEVK